MAKETFFEAKDEYETPKWVLKKIGKYLHISLEDLYYPVKDAKLFNSFDSYDATVEDYPDRANFLNLPFHVGSL